MVAPSPILVGRRFYPRSTERGYFFERPLNALLRRTDEPAGSMAGLRYVEDQDDGPVGIAFMVVLALGHDERLLFAGRAEK